MRRIALISSLALVTLLIVSACGGLTGSAQSVSSDFYAGAPDMEMVESEAAYAEPGDYRDLASTTITIERLVIRTADLDIIVADTDDALTQVDDLVDELGGYIVSSDTYQYQDGIQASVTIRVPAESFEAALGELRDIATTVVHESISGQDVTEEYVDLSSRLRHLRAKEDQLLEFLENAEDTEAVLAVYEELSYTQQEIEQVSGRMEYLENQAAMSTITLSITPDALAQPLEVSGWNLSGTAREALEDLLDILEGLVKGLIYLIILVLPTLFLLSLPFVAAFFIIRWIMRLYKSRIKKA